MKQIELFLASSINEFKTERIAIGNFFRKIENVLIEYDIRIKLFECEFSDNSIQNKRMQETYNDRIRESEIFLMLVGKRLGQYTLEEYDVAVDAKVPNKYVFFFECEEDESIKNFKNNLKDDVNSINFKDIKELNYEIAKILKFVLGDLVNIEVNEEMLLIDDNKIKY